MLKLNGDNTAFLYETRDKERAEALGLTMWTGDCRPGIYTYFSSKADGLSLVPDYNPYQVLSLFTEADTPAKLALLDLYLAYQESYADGTPTVFAAAPGLEYAPYQNAAIQYGLKRKNVLFGDEPGLGKTVEALGLARERGAERMLIVVPAAVRLQWEREVRRWCPHFRKVRTILKSSEGYDPGANVTILSYNALQNDDLRDRLMGARWDNIVLDEAHYLKNHEASRTTNVLGGYTAGAEGLCSRANTITALTGTPMPNRPREIYTLARALDWEALGSTSLTGFIERFNPSITFGSGYEKAVARNHAELQARLRSHFMIRRRKAAVLKDLPPKQYELTLIEPNGEIRNVLKAESLLHVDPDDRSTFLGADGSIDGAIATVRKEMGLAKIPRIVEHVRYILEGGVNKLVLFLYHREVLDTVANGLASFRPALIKGGTTPLRREAERDRFIRDPRCRVFIGQILAAGTGIDGLQRVTDRVVFGEADWVPGNNEQAVDRVHRYGQNSHVLAEFLVAPGSLDEKILGSAIAKMGDLNEALDVRSA